MSDMEIYYGKFKKSDLPIEPDDTDEHYDREEKDKCLYIKIKDQLYIVTKIDDIDPFGFILHLPPSDEHQFIAYWYNGGAGVHEVVRDIIEGTLK